MFRPFVTSTQPTMASANFCRPIPDALESSSHWQNCGSLQGNARDLPTYTRCIYLHGFRKVLGFEYISLLTRRDRLICYSCSLGQWFAFSFLQILLRNEHPCRSVNRSPCRADSGLAPSSHQNTTTYIGIAPVQDPTKKTGRSRAPYCF